MKQTKKNIPKTFSKSFY